MKQQLKKISKKEDGFTIIEVLIVLAIAALILVVVLVAIPQLQRNQRNSARQSDAARVVTSVQNWSANNNGQVFPTNPTDGPGALDSVVNDLGDLTQYDIAESPAESDLEAEVFATSLEAIDDLTTLRIVPGASCTNDPDPGSVTNTDVASRNVAVQYAVEQAGNQVEGRCVDS